MPQPIAIHEIRRWARVICLKCGDPVVDLERLEKVPAAKRLNEAAAISTEGRKCKRCGTIHPKIAKDDEDYITFWAGPPTAKDVKREENSYKLYRTFSPRRSSGWPTRPWRRSAAR